MKACNRQLLYLSFIENGSKKPFFYQKLLKTSEMLDFTTAFGVKYVFDDVIREILMLAKIFEYTLTASMMVYNYNYKVS